MIRKDHVTRTPYRHYNHKSRYFKRSTYQHCFEQRQYLAFILKKINSNAVWSQNSSRSWNHNTKILTKNPTNAEFHIGSNLGGLTLQQYYYSVQYLEYHTDSFHRL
jgi:hypothetical protein